MDDLNYELMYGVVRTVSNIISWLFGMIVVILCAYVALITACDVVYLSLPILRENLKKLYDGSMPGGLHLVSDDALNSLEEAYRTDGHPMTIYLRRRISTYMFLAITVTVLVTGGESLMKIIGNSVYKLLQAIGFI